MRTDPSSTLAMLKTVGSHPIVRGFPEGAIVVFDEDLRYLCAGGDGLSIVGLTRETIEGKTIYEVFPDEVFALLEEPYRKIFAGVEATLDIAFGGRVFMHRIAPLLDDSGEIVAGIGFALDVTESRRIESAIRTSEQLLTIERRRLRDAEFIGHSGSWEWDLIGDVITWSDGLFALHGLQPMDFPGGYPQAASRVHPDDRPIVDAAMESAKRNEPVQFRYRVARAADAETRWFDSHVSGVLDESGKLVRLVGAVADVTDMVKAQKEVLETNAFLNAVLTASPDYTFVTDVRSGQMVFGSHDRDLLGRTSEETQRLGFENIVHPDDIAALRQLNAESVTLEEGGALNIRYRLKHEDGSWHWMSRHVVPFRRDDEGHVSEVLGVVRDISDIVKAEEMSRHDALHDELTGLPNRSLMLDRLEASLLRSARDGREVSVLFCDLDNFKEVNDSAGHGAGDAVLVEVASRLLGTVRDGDTVARVGGDEFIVIVEPWSRNNVERSTQKGSVSGREIGLDVAKRIIHAISTPVRIGGVDHEVSVSIGVAFPSLRAPHGSLIDAARQAVEDADAAMYLAKRDGKNRMHVSDVSS